MPCQGTCTWWIQKMKTTKITTSLNDVTACSQEKSSSSSRPTVTLEYYHGRPRSSANTNTTALGLHWPNCCKFS